MDNLARFYTESIFSDLLVQEIKLQDPKLIIDLGIGAGSLTSAAFRKWRNATFLASDIDINQIKRTEKKFPFVKIVEANGLEMNLGKKLNIVVDSVDVAICNPPYLRIPTQDNNFSKLFKRIGFNNCKNLRYLTSDLIFLAQNILLLKEGGVLGIILPDGLLSNWEFIEFRKDLINNHTIISVIQLPDNIFKKTEARTHILILKKGITQKKSKVNLFLSDQSGNLIEYLTTQPSFLTQRMDYFYHKCQSLNYSLTTRTITLNKIGAEIKRGKFTHKQLKLLTNNYIHTTSLTHKAELFLTSDVDKIDCSPVFTEENDILLARVGRGCIGKVSKVLGGNQLISDCVYRIRVPKEYLDQTWESFCSESGQRWLKSLSHGVCSRVLSKCDLQNFPISIK